MRITYDGEADILWIRLGSGGISDSDELESGMILDYDAEGHVVGLEIHRASTRIENPRAIEFAVAS
jgi:uncharacterized protein YuzE